MEVGFAYAVIGGMLGVFSPCNALLLPAFFANIAASRAKLLSLGAVFLAGLLITLVPLGLGLGWLGGTLSIDRGVLLTGAGWVLIVLGLGHGAGRRVRFFPVHPRVAGLRRRPGRWSGPLRWAPFRVWRGSAPGRCSVPSSPSR